MKTRILLPLLTALTLGFFGCSAASRFEMNTEIFLTAEEALSAHDTLLDEIDQQIVRRASPATDRLFFVTPTKEIVRERGVDVEPGAPESDIEYTTQVLYDDNKHFGTFIEVAGLAGQLLREESDNPKARAEEMKRDYDAIVYLEIISPTESGWYLITMPDNTTTPIEFGIDDSNSRYPKIKGWLNSLEKQLRL